VFGTGRLCGIPYTSICTERKCGASFHLLKIRWSLFFVFDFDGMSVEYITHTLYILYCRFLKTRQARLCATSNVFDVRSRGSLVSNRQSLNFGICNCPAETSFLTQRFVCDRGCLSTAEKKVLILVPALFLAGGKRYMLPFI